MKNYIVPENVLMSLTNFLDFVSKYKEAPQAMSKELIDIVNKAVPFAEYIEKVDAPTGDSPDANN
jgi:hypothetical protein